ncbi:hypothetical protein FisN_15Lh116 [Fistulifera solaris]|uniref:MYND-type domain-containing protein n=1 Tax=Fistulifera solaris TaxID=1519565 RepID=A0A1Z5KB26_FISSO|nr:hypothetical protein FisN_15Lh116 [Fistulifera solaris]|eukprot:GAX23396.1 hypothetical protein FisN_15Lh116 [Fistulifera solaris]
MEDTDALRQYITCDAEGCGETHPASRCSNCKMVYYCNRTCQRKDWKRHKPDCHGVDDMRKRCTGIGDLSEIQEITGIMPGESNTAETCGICLEEKMVNPMIFTKCQHAFCFACLVRLQSLGRGPHSTVNGTKCPYCRSEIPDLVKSSTSRISVMAARAGRRDLPEEEREACVAMAMEEIEKLYNAGDTDLMFFLIPMRARLLSLRGDHRAAIDVMQEALPEWIKMVEEGNSLRENLFGLTQMESLPEGRITLRNTDLIEAYLQIAEYQERLEDWVAAKKTYQKIMMEFNDVDDFTPPQQRKVFFGSSVCAYHLKNYEIAIDLGEAALQTNRAFPGVHKALALTHKAAGNIDKARQLAAQGVLYEAPWDDENKEETWQFWKEINEE